MRTLLLTLSLFFFILNTYSQEKTGNRAPSSQIGTASEEETIQWLVEKFTKHNINNGKHVFNECQITEYTKNYGISRSGSIFLYDIKRVYESDGYIAIETNKNSIATWLSFQNQESEPPSNVFKVKNYVTTINAFGEADFVNRLNAALLNLKSICNKKGKKEGEKF